MLDPNTRSFAQKIRDRKHYRILLYFEALYMIVLAFAIMFNMPLFWRLISIQAVICIIVFIVGSYLNWHDKKTGREIPVKKDHDFFWNSFIARTPIQKQKLFYHTIGVLAMLASFCIALFAYGQLYITVYAKANPHALGVVENLTLYADVFYVLTMFGVLFGLLFGKKRLERNSSVTAILLSLILIAIYPQAWGGYVIGLIASSAGYWLYRNNQL